MWSGHIRVQSLSRAERKRFIVARFRSGENRDETVKLHVCIDLSPGLPRHIWKMAPTCFCFGKTLIYLLNIFKNIYISTHAAEIPISKMAK